jgi:hypothetical protein
VQAKLGIKQGQWQAARRALRGLHGGMSTAAARAINRTLPTGRKVADQEARKEYTVKSAAFKAQCRIIRAAPRFGRLSGTLEVGYRPLQIYNFFQVAPRKPFHELKRKPRGGIRANVKRSTGRRVIPGAFVARLQSGHVAVLERFGPKSRRARWAKVSGRSGARVEVFEYRQKTREIYGPSPAAMLKSLDVWPKVEREMQATLTKRFDHEVTNLLRQAGRR